jgi:glucose/mannose-6-phosphate isomerase
VAPAEQGGADLDDVDSMLRGDPGQLLRATAGAGGQIRRALVELEPARLEGARADGRPRGLAVVGMGGSGISGDVLAAVAGVGAPLPILTVRSATLPGWLGPLDAVVAVSCSGSTRETLTAATEAGRRGCRLFGVGAPGSELERVVAAASGTFLPVDAQGLMPRAALWTLATPLLRVGAAMGVLAIEDHDLLTAADVLDELAVANGLAVPVAQCEAKSLALLLTGAVPTVWGDSPLAAVAAYRMACQLNENAKIPCAWGAIPEAAHNQIVTFDGPYGARDTRADLFRDPVEDGPAPVRAQLVLLRDTERRPEDARSGELAAELATARGMAPFVVAATAGHPVTRLASLVGVLDWASVYTALALGIDPTPIGPISELKERSGR